MTSTPWAILLCKFSDQPNEPRTKQFYERLFTRAGSGSLNMVDFFSDVSHGQIDVGSSQVFGWLTLDKARSDYICVSGYGVNGQALYAAIFEQRGDPAWQARHGLTGQQYQQTFDQLVAQGYRLVCVSGYNIDGQVRFAAIFEQGQAPLWQARHGLTAAQYQQTFDQLVAQGYQLQCVSGYEANP